MILLDESLEVITLTSCPRFTVSLDKLNATVSTPPIWIGGNLETNSRIRKIRMPSEIYLYCYTIFQIRSRELLAFHYDMSDPKKNLLSKNKKCLFS